MITCKCEQCGGEFPLNETLQVEARILCDACCDQILAQEHAPLKNLQRQTDPTVCANCRKDNGTTALPLLAGAPVCGTCEAFFRHRTFPPWIKLALAAILALVAVSLVWNARFFRAYLALHRFATYSLQGQVEAACAQMSSAAAFVPENEDLRVLATFFEGIVLLRQDQNAAALKKLERYRNRLPVAYDVESLIVQAQMGVAFDAKDYDGFLSGAQALHQRRPQDATSQATLASAWACKYAVTGETTFQDQALLCLKQAEDMAQGNPDFKEYGERIRYRLATREIIDRKEFQKRFPNGWNGQKEE